MPHKKFLWLLVILPLLTGLLTGCVGPALPLGDRAVVKMVAVGAGTNNYHVKVLYLTSNKESSTGDAQENTPHVLDGSGVSVTDALFDACDRAGKQMFFAQNELLLLDDGLNREEVIGALREFSAERFSGARAYVFSAKMDSLPQKETAVYELAVRLEELGGKEGRPLYLFSDNSACLLPLFINEESGVKTTGGLVYPVGGEPFELTGRCWEFYRAVRGGQEKINCLSGPDRCAVTRLKLVSEVTQTNGVLTLHLTLDGSISDYEGALLPDEVTQMAENEIEQIFSRFYSDIYLSRQADLLCLDQQMTRYGRKQWRDQVEKNGLAFLPETVIFHCNLHMES